MGIKEQVQVRLIMKGNVQRTYNTANSKVRIPLFHVTIFKFPSGSPENENQDKNSLGEQPVENAQILVRVMPETLIQTQANS